MKLRKSGGRFRFGAFFGHSNHNNSSSSNNTATTAAGQTNNNNSAKSSSLKTSSATSLIRRSSSRLNIAACEVADNPTGSEGSSTPILLSVRKRSTSDSGYSGEDYTSSSHCGEDSPVPGPPRSSHGKPGRLSFLRLFHKSSATLQLQHPKTELNPDKPYKGTLVTSLSSSKRAGRSQQQQKKKPLAAMTSSSLSSLNSSCAAQQRPPQKVPSLPLGPAIHHSSSNSVISTGDESSSGGRGSSSNYDSGAFSRTSSPTEAYSHEVNLSLSLSRLALVEPLVAPRLVMAACRGQWPLDDFKEEEDSVDASLMLSCLDAAARPSQIAERRRQHRQQMRARSVSCARKASNMDVTVSVGANTMLTIAPNQSPRTPLRRSRSGLPVLGTSVLNTSGGGGSLTNSPVKPARISSPSKRAVRNRISTVYLDSGEPSLTLSCKVGKSGAERNARKHKHPVGRSNSVVTVMGSQVPTGQSAHCDPRFCSERVTVNGQHHCARHHMISAANSSSLTMPRDLINYRNNNNNANIVTTTAMMHDQATTTATASDDVETQPNSLINI